MVEQTFIAHRRDTGEEVPFPVSFPDSEAANRLWRWDAEHSPYPLTPLSQEFNRGPGGPAIAAQSLGAPPSPPMPNVFANGYRYAGGAGGAYGSDAPEYIKTVSEMAPRIEELWDRGWRLEIEERGRHIASFDYASLTLPQLVERLESLVDVIRQNMVLMFQAAHLVSYSRSLLVQFCHTYIGEAAEPLVTDLLQGTYTESFESGAALWDAAQLLAQDPQTLDLLQNNPSPAGLEQLAASEAGRRFSQAFSAWLERYGNRNGTFGELAEPTWQEDPKVPIAMALQYAQAPDPRIGRQRALETRRQLQAEFEKRLSSESQLAAFRALLQNADPYVGVRESRDHATIMASTAVRVPALETGRRLVEQGSIAAPDDIFFLRFEELELAAAAASSDFKELVSQRRQTYEYWRGVSPPPSIGGEAAAPAEDPRMLRGLAASSGVVTATARIVLSLTEAHRLQQGEILVARGTSPAWTPLFGTAAAVVTEGGGLLSHCAIVAREYGIPAVVGAGGATRRIADGSQITVDGNKGRVLFVE